MTISRAVTGPNAILPPRVASSDCDKEDSQVSRSPWWDVMPAKQDRSALVAAAGSRRQSPHNSELVRDHAGIAVSIQALDEARHANGGSP